MRKSLPTILGFILLSAILFAGTWKGSFLSSDGAIYAQSARELLRHGNILTPTWQGEVLFEKGPLHTALIASGLALFGENEFGARFSTVLMAILFALMVFLFARRLGMDRTSSWVAVFCAVFPQVFFFTTRRPLAEIPSVAIGMAGLYILLFHGRWFWAGLMFGLVLLIKYPIGILYMGIGLAGIWLLRRPARDWVLAAIVAIILAAPWHIYMSLRFGANFWDVYLFYHLFGRVSHAIATKADPFFYMKVLVPQDLVFFGLWALGGMWAAYKSIAGDRKALFLLLFAIMAVLPAQVSATRHVHYLVWALPAFGLLTGYALNQVSPRASLSAGLAVVLALSGVTLNMQHMVNPDYGHSSKALCQRLKGTDILNHISGTFQLYDPDLTWYCDKNFMIWNRDPAFQRAVGDIPMMRPFVRELNAGAVDGMTVTGTILVTAKRNLPAITGACSRVMEPKLVNEMLHSPLALAGFSKKACEAINRAVLRR